MIHAIGISPILSFFLAIAGFFLPLVIPDLSWPWNAALCLASVFGLLLLGRKIFRKLDLQ